MPKKKSLALLSSVLIASQVLGVSAGTAVAVNSPTDQDLHAHVEEAAIDTRDSLPSILPTTQQLEAAQQLIVDAGEGLKIEWNHLFGTPASITKSEGYISEARTGDAESIARDWLMENKALFSLTAEDIQNLTVIRNYKVEGTNLSPVTFQQTVNGIESVFGGRIIVAVNEEGKILSVASNAGPTGEFAGEFSLSPEDALSSVVRSLTPDLVYSPTALKDEKGWKVYDGLDVFPTEQRVKQAAFFSNGEIRPAYRVLFIEELDKAFEVVVDAENGKTLYQRSLVDHLDPEGLIFENYPGAPAGGNQVSKSFKGDLEASPNGWLLPTNDLGVTTFGNNASAYANWSNFLVPADTLIRPVSPLGQFNYPFLNAWQESKGAIVPPSYAEDVNSATANLFYHHNLFHDYFYNLGWTEPAGNLQANNNGKGGLGGDPILGLVQAGAVTGGEPTYTGRDNAYMLTLPDGIAAWSGMFLWEPIAGAFEGAYADGDYDAGIIYHEYSHALSNRLVAGGEALGSHQSGSMGEGWGDWFGMHYLIKNGLQEEPVVGAYVTDNDERGIRSWSLAEAPLNYGDIGYDIIGPEVHADGDIWAAILWHVREALIQNYGKEEGERVAEQLVLDAMPISVPDPSMEDMRTAIIASDLERYDGKYRDTLWTAFSQRGLGDDAYSAGGDDTDPQPAFNHPDAEHNGQLLGRVVNEQTNKPIEGVRIFIGQYEARTSPVVQTTEKGGFALDMVEGTYDITIQARGYGSRTLEDVKITAGSKERWNLKLSPNVASSFNGASIASVSDASASNPVKLAIDDTEASVYASEQKEEGFTGSEFIVDLAGDKPLSISQLHISAMKDVAKARFATLKDFAVQASVDGENWTTILEDNFTAGKPRPATPDLDYQEYVLDTPAQATQLKFIAKSAQDDAQGYIQLAELQAFTGDKAKITPLELEPEEAFTASGTIQVGNAGTGVGVLAGVDDATLAVTQNEFVTTQNPEPASQGVDGYVVTLPEQYADGIHNVSITGTSESGHDIDVFFYDAEFNVIGNIATSAANESGVVPGGTKYIYVGLYSGANTSFNVNVSSPY
ncbi:M36 family metallopeptidase [Planococcus halotolerans]|uniref:Coagulation factor 5/8 type-like protein n=1 Tax=Planococcus halotolerans TaxID=2233542 RepID=A0A365L8L8_9BACL|nr:M36 family metallopeptidase [Planococcus halotolerans]RAZ81441.1 coagulation factor 5/8 type-like protein [Planococcus halotolerans]